MGSILLLIVLGLTFISIGITIIQSGVNVWNKWGIFQDFRAEEWYVKWFFGFMFIMPGLGILLHSLRKKTYRHFRETENNKHRNILICPVCEEVFDRYNVPTIRCPSCDVPLEELEGFYDRRFELRGGRENHSLAHSDQIDADSPSTFTVSVDIWKRIYNFFIDLVALPICMFPIFAGPLGFDFAMLMILFSVPLNYLLGEFLFGQTLGKFASDTVVVDEDWNKPSFGKVLRRTLIRLIPWDPFSAFKTSPPRPWHDAWSHTYVVDLRLAKRKRKSLQAEETA